MTENMNYDPNHMSKLQQDAIRRAREMQARSRSAQQRNLNRQPAAPNNGPQEPPKPPEHNDEKTKAGVNAGFNMNTAEFGHSGELLDYLMKDSERTLILFLLILLLEEKANTGLIFALIYLLI